MGVHVTAEDLQGEQTITVTKENHRLRTLTIQKRDAESGEPIPGTSFHIEGVNLGYTLVMYEVYGEIENRGLNPYVGFLHQDRERHPTLASDLMEEWRPVLIDAVVLSLIQGHEIQREHFYYDQESGACLLKDDGMKIFFRKLENKLHSEMKYLDYLSTRTSFRRAIWHQVGLLVRAIESEDVEEYLPLRIR